MLKMLAWSIWFRFCGILLCPFLNLYCLLTSKDKYPEWAYTLDNDEDGFTGDKRNWYSEYLGIDIKSKSLLYRWYRSIRWCWRNQSFNHRYNDKCSVCVNPFAEPSFKIISIEGNTYHHEQRYSFEPDKIEKKWYKFVFEVKGKRYTSEFSLTPLNSEEYRTKRKGLKIYPFFYFDSWWIEKIKREDWPPYKDRAVFVWNSRVRKYKEEGA